MNECWVYCLPKFPNPRFQNRHWFTAPCSTRLSKLFPALCYSQVSTSSSRRRPCSGTPISSFALLRLSCLPSQFYTPCLTLCYSLALPDKSSSPISVFYNCVWLKSDLQFLDNILCNRTILLASVCLLAGITSESQGKIINGISCWKKW